MHPVHCKQYIYLNYVTLLKNYSLTLHRNQQTVLLIPQGWTCCSVNAHYLRLHMLIELLHDEFHMWLHFWCEQIAVLWVRVGISVITGLLCKERLCPFSGRLVVGYFWMLVCVLTAAAYSPYGLVGVGANLLCNSWAGLHVDWPHLTVLFSLALLLFLWNQVAL